MDWWPVMAEKEKKKKAAPNAKKRSQKKNWQLTAGHGGEGQQGREQTAQLGDLVGQTAAGV